MHGTQLHIPQLTPVNKKLLIVFAGCFILQALAEKMSGVSVLHILGLSGDLFVRGRLYQLLTYPLVQVGLTGLLFDCLVVWFIGSELERIWGGKTYFKFLLASMLSAGLFYLLFSLLFATRFPLVGMTGISYALLFAYAVLFPNRILTFMLIFPMKAKYFCMILMGILLFGGLISNNPTSWGHLGAVFGAFAHMYLVTMYRLKQGPQWGKILQGRLKKKRHLHIVEEGEGEDKDGPTYWH